MTAARPDAALKLNGQAVYGMDAELPGMLWGALVLSPVAAGRHPTVDLSAARAIPGVVAIDGSDLAELLPNGVGDPERPLFPREEIAYRSQPIAAIAAPTLADARRAARMVRLTVESAPALAELDTLFPEWPGSAEATSPQVIAHVHARTGDVDQVFRAADTVYAETYRTSGIHQVAIEPHACVAELSDGRYRLRSSTQTPFGLREDTASLLGVPESQVVVEGTWVGGGFGGKAAALIEPYALLLAKRSGRPVRLALTYREEFLTGRTTLPAVVRIATAVRAGAMVGRRVQLLLDAGASLPGRDFATGYAIAFLAGPYRIPAVELEGYAVRTSKPPFGPHRAPFAPQCAFVQESHTDGLARHLGVDPVEFRRRAAWVEGDRTALGQTVLPFGLTELLDRAQRRVQLWRADLPNDHGIGVGSGFWSTGTGAGGEVRLRLTATELVIEEGEREIGSGSVIRGLSAAAERELGLPREAIRVDYLDTDRAPFDSGVFGSRTLGALGQAVMKAAEALRTELRRRTGATDLHLRAEPGRLVVEMDGARAPVASLLTDDERRTGGIVTEARHYGKAGKIEEERVIAGSFYPYTDFTAATHVAEVAVDRETGAVEVVRYAAFQDVGTLLDPEMARGQVEGAVVMGLGEALTEEMLWGEEAKLGNPGLLDYRIPTLGEVPPIDVEFVEGFRGAGPWGTKGLGEPPIIPVPATIANAVADAVGVRLTELPLSPERVARALKVV